MHWLWENVLSNPSMLILIGQVLGIILSLIGYKRWREKVAEGKWDDLWRAAEAAVSETWNDYVRNLKMANADGKLTERERIEALSMAKEKLIAIAKSRGVDVLKTVGARALPAIIEMIIRNRKPDKIASA